MNNALICVGSPLQAICMWEAMSFYNIDAYKLLVIDDGMRLGQIKSFLDNRSLIYSVIPYHVSSWKNFIRLLRIASFFKGKYDLLLMGDYRLTGNRMELLPWIKANGKIVYLDDGTYIISMAKGLIIETGITKVRNILMNIVCKLKNISYKNIFTIYAKDIMIPGYSIVENKMIALQKPSMKQNRDIFFIGTNPKLYCEYLGIDYNHYLLLIGKLISELKGYNSNMHVVYIPHGRDSTFETEEICKKMNVEYRRLSVCIELYMLSLSTFPQEVWGLGSTALYTLKKIYPNAKYVNVSIIGSNLSSVQEYGEIANLYEKKGIVNLVIE